MKLGLGLGLSRNESAGGGGGGGAALLSSVITTGMIAEWDATISDSYSGSGSTLANLVSSPADSELQSAYDLTLGAGATFTGTAGDSAAYFALDGVNGQFILSSITSYLAQYQRTDLVRPITFLIAMRTAASLTNNSYIFSNGTTGSGQYSMSYRYDATGDLEARIRNNATLDTAAIASAALSTSTDTLLAFTSDLGQSGAEQYAVNADTFSSWTDPASGLTNDTSSTTFNISGLPTGSGQMDSGTRVYTIAVVNKIISAAELAAARDLLEARHSRTY